MVYGLWFRVNGVPAACHLDEVPRYFGESGHALVEG
jgi:hypothetical protein